MIYHSTSKRPILLVGSGARSAGASALIYEFIEKTHIPVLTTMNAVDLVQDKYRIGFIGTYGNRIANMILNECDLLISLGARLGLRQIGHKNELFAPKAELIRIDVDQYELARQIKENEEDYHMDAKYFLEQLMKEDIPDYKAWWDTCFAAKEIVDRIDVVEGNQCIEKIGSLLPENPIVAVDVGQNECWTAQSLVLKGTEGRILIGGGYGAMGCGLPFAIGASISRGNAVTFCITGDGGLQMNIQELQTVASEHLPIKIFVLNNRALAKISEVQRGSYKGRYMITTKDSGYTVPDFEKVSKAYGIRAATLQSYNELDGYKNWLEDEDPCLLNIMLSEDTELIPKIKWETCTIKPDLDETLLEQVKALFKG